MVATALDSPFDVESFIHDYYDAWSGTNLDRIMSYYADDVVLQIPGLLMEGKAAVRDQFAQPFTSAFPGNRHIIKNMIHGPGVVTVEFSFEAQHTGAFAGHAATGAQISLPGCGVYEYDSAKRQITAGRIYFDVATLLQTITDLIENDRQKAAEALQFNKHNLILITDLIPTLIHVLRTDGSVLYVNKAVLDYFGATLEDVQKEDYRARFFHPEDVERVREQRQNALLRPVSFENEQRALGKDGKYRWFLIRYNPLLDQHGKVDRWYVAAFDIEDRKRAEEDVRRSEEALTRARAELAHMARITTLSALTASIAHEINQPISAVTTSAGACLRWLNRDQPEVQRAREAAMRIEEDGKRAAEIITHLKSFYKKDVSQQRELVSVNDVVGEMLMLLRSEANRHSVVMRTELAADLPSVNADRVLLQQVLMNLMQNGSEAMSERGGELKISTRREGEDVMVSVSDTGVGIPSDKMDEIFDAFVTTKCGGTGMGLAISNTIIESHGGRLWATENLSRGATFHFTLPIEPRRISDH